MDLNVARGEQIQLIGTEIFMKEIFPESFLKVNHNSKTPYFTWCA